MVIRTKCAEFMDLVMKYIHLGDEECFSYFDEHFSNGDQDFQQIIREEMPLIKEILFQDIEFYMDSDPAANNEEEIIIAYPGFYAITHYRVAHLLRELGFIMESRIIAEMAHSATGIDIHPGAEIGVPFFIDHGTGVVIGETAVIGKRVKIYQGVTLGALSLSKGRALKGTKRHPTIKDDVTIYSGASILGDIVIENDVTIGSNAFVIKSVPAHMKLTIGKPTLIMKQKN